MGGEGDEMGGEEGRVMRWEGRGGEGRGGRGGRRGEGGEGREGRGGEGRVMRWEGRVMRWEGGLHTYCTQQLSG